MADLPTAFQKFNSEIELTTAQSDSLRRAHTTLRERLEGYPTLSPWIVNTFLHGSYQRSTAVRPAEGCRSDVDIIVVTKLDRSRYTPHAAMELFRPFFRTYYLDKYRFQGRSIGVALSDVDLDVVITSAPSEVDQRALKAEGLKISPTLEQIQERFEISRAAEPVWKTEPLWIPDRDAREWQRTHPLAQLRWTVQKNKSTNKHFVRVVKSIKWWRRAMQPTPKHPKGYPLEHIIGDCCPDGITSVAEGVTRTLERIVSDFSVAVMFGLDLTSRDRGVDQNVLKRLDKAEFAKFYGHVKVAAQLARKAYDAQDPRVSAALWRNLFGSRFP